MTYLELFFDLVFVLTLTQLTDRALRRTERPRAAPGRTDARRHLVDVRRLCVADERGQRAHDLAPRCCCSAGWPPSSCSRSRSRDAFEGTGLAFGLAYLVIVVIHAVLFTRATPRRRRGRSSRSRRYNLSPALVVLVGGVAGGHAQYVPLGGGGPVRVADAADPGTSGFLIAPAHFVERHGAGRDHRDRRVRRRDRAGASHLPVDARWSPSPSSDSRSRACLWWIYFGGDEERAERALAGAAAAQARACRTARLRLLAHADAARDHRRGGRRAARRSAHPFDSLTWARAAILAGGVAVYLAGDVAFRRELRIGRLELRTGGALLSLAAIPVGVGLSPFAETAVLVALLVAVLLAEATQARAGS